jgi:membrane-bound serine protease (ClpP class)
VALIRSLAQFHGRNQQWAERFVREAATLTAQEALQEGVVDMVAPDLATLLRQAEGRTVHLTTGKAILHLGVARIMSFSPTWRERLLMVLGDPQLAYVLLLVGLYGIIMEFIHPGTTIPGTVGAVALLLALYALQVLPVSLAGLGLLLLGLVLMVAEGFVPGFGILGLGGSVSFVIGSVMFLDQAGAAWSWGQGLGVGGGLAMGLMILALAMKARRMQRRGGVTGDAALVGSQGTALEDFTGTGVVRVHGELWQAHSTQPIRCGQQVVVQGRRGLTLLVAPLEEGVIRSSSP